MNACISLKRWGNTKTEAILAMLDDKYKKQAKAEMKDKPMPEELNSALIKFKATKKTLRAMTKELKSKAKEHGYYLTDNYDENEDKLIFDTNTCFVPRSLTEKIQKATNLQSLGKKQEAKNILDKIIKDEGLI